jgi:hypothetical protein
LGARCDCALCNSIKALGREPPPNSPCSLCSELRVLGVKVFGLWSETKQVVVAVASYTNPNDANAVIEPQPSATPSTAPAKTSLKKCMPSTTRDTAMLTAKKNKGASNPG